MKPRVRSIGDIPLARTVRATMPVRMVSTVPAQIIGLGIDWGIRKGARADLLIARADSIDDLVASGALERTVMFDGRVVSSTSTQRL